MAPESAVEILLVEDNPNDEELALHARRKFHLSNRVQVARDGEEALDFIFGRAAFAGRDPHRTPDLILLDLKRPKVNGLEVLAEIRADPSTRTIPVVVLTSSAEDRDISRGYELGANSFTVKPVAFDQFTEVVRTLRMPPALGEDARRSATCIASLLRLVNTRGARPARHSPRGSCGGHGSCRLKRERPTRRSDRLSASALSQ